MKVTDIVKKDGSVKIPGTFQFIGSWNGLNFINEKNDMFFQTMGNSEYLQYGYLKDEVYDYIYQMEPKGLVPMVANEKNLGAGSKPWRDIFVGNISKSDTGYCKLTNGLILQWGYVKDLPGSTITRIPLPIAFPNFILCINVTPGLYHRMNNQAWSTSGGQSYISVANGAGAYTTDCYWIAIGY